MGLFLSQSRGLFVRTWHYQRRQRGVNVCQFIVSPLLLVLLALLAKVFRESPDGGVPAFATAVAGGWAPQFIRPDACTANRATLRSGLCFTAPFQPRPFVVPVLDATPSGGAAGGGGSPVGSVHYEACAAETSEELLGACLAAGAGPNAPAANSSGLLAGWSLPAVYPGLLDTGPAGFGTTQTSYDGVLLHGAFRGNASDPRYLALVEASRRGVVDTLYGTRSQGFTDRAAFYDLMYKAPRAANAFPAYPTALAIDRYAGGGATAGAPPPTGPITVDATVFYNISEVLEYNCTEECPIVAGVAALTDAVIKDAVGPAASASVYLRRFPETDSVTQNNFIELVVGIALALLFHFLLPGFLRMLVYERSAGLRQMMQMHGLRTSHYWVATYLGFYVQYFCAALLLVVVGLAARIAFFTDNSPLAYVPLFFIWGHTMIALAFVLAPWFTSPETALIFGWMAVILISLMGGPYLGTLFASDAEESLFNSVSILPSFAFMRAVYYAAAFNAGGRGVTFSGGEYAGVSLGMCEGDGPFCTVFLFLVVQWAVLLVAGLYLDRVLPGAGSIREHPLFFLGVQRGAGWRVLPSQRRADAAAAAASVGAVKSSDVGMSESDEEAAGAGVSASEPADVAEERAQAAAAGDGAAGVVVRDLVKVFPGQPPKRAVDGLSLVIAQDSVFGLLGANGAGKSSTIAILTGLLAPTSGDVFINGTPLSADVRGIHRGLGVCPQHDVLWGTLTGEEHLVLYARLKGVADVAAAVSAGLASVELTEAAKRQVMKYSGGMKRRLSVAIAFIGNPSIVLLDEPSAGLDPRSRYRLWECIQTHKAGKTVLLTTHSMEEAERLCNRVGIIAGRLLAVGSPSALKVRLSSGYRLTASVPAARVAELAALITTELSSDAALLPDSLGGSVSYSLPRDVDLARVFTVMEASRESYEVRDWGVSQSSLEDVFVGITTAHARRQGMLDLELG